MLINVSIYCCFVSSILFVVLFLRLRIDKPGQCCHLLDKLISVTFNTSSYACCRVNHSLSEWTGKGKPKERSEVNLPKCLSCLSPLISKLSQWEMPGDYSRTLMCGSVPLNLTAKILCDLSKIDVDVVTGNYRMNQKSTFIRHTDT